MASLGLRGATGGLSLMLAACGTAPFDAPVSDRAGYPTVRNVVQKIECEIVATRDDRAINSAWVKERFALKTPPLLPFDQWVAAVTISLTVNDTEGLSPTASGLSLSFIDPLKLAGNTFGFGGAAILYQNRQRIFTETYTVDIKKINPSYCSTKVWGTFDLEGDLGLRDLIYAGLHSIIKDEADTFETSKAGSSPDSFGGTVSFDVFKGVSGIGPTFTLTRFKGQGGLGIQRDDMHKIVITFQPVAAAGPAASVATAKSDALANNATLHLRSDLHDIAQATSRP
jgi:hypothetical protein